ncbi:hypothetical protein [Amycolatopsis minnesotensis]|uniref:Tetratricopeptide repeat protein n=1 Tax=Amycolatopsis minnesotensis TaxID=337894 RepID=A0ABN2Q4H1_9PSEU
MRARNLALVLTAALVLYIVMLADRAIALFRSGETSGVLLGVGVMVLPVLGAWMIVATWRSGSKIQRLARSLEAEGGLPNVEDLPRMPSGRVDRKAADAWFEDRKAELEAHPDDWRYWYRLAYAYDVAGDRKRARDTMRRAVELAKAV